jgi:hypothetical protein
MFGNLGIWSGGVLLPYLFGHTPTLRFQRRL